ncbi:MAG TPA: hypothetical protein VFM18_18495 [Methanosarcina sp.]|nr:hypothetical protein [Methanosarcina sp.]
MIHPSNMVTYSTSAYDWQPWQRNFAWLPRIRNKKFIWLKHYYWRVGLPIVGGVAFEMQFTTNPNIVFTEGTEFRAWKEWFAWRPVKIKGRWHWMKKVYRRAKTKTYSTMDDWTEYQYGDEFDILKSL